MVNDSIDGMGQPFSRNLFETFPDLKQPIHDKYVPHDSAYPTNDQGESDTLELDTSGHYSL